MAKHPYLGFNDRILVDSGNLLSVGANLSKFFLCLQPITWAKISTEGRGGKEVNADTCHEPSVPF